ncbi:MAG: cation diffusion facilitator family transporter [candidate division KSB1 bacterium]|nr:cation diffusion facilitator family transporter [candidate division KSB1 bacterium]
MFIPSLPEEEKRWRVAATEGWASIVVNVLLSALKILGSLASGSVALLADAFHSLSDVVTSAIIVVAYRLAKLPSDERHPFGHGRAEHAASLVVAVLLVVAGFELGKSSLARVLHPQSVDASSWVLGLVIVSIVAKELLAQFSHRLAVAIQSQALEADTWHHRTDAISAAVVLVALILSRYGIVRADGIAGLIVSGFIVYIGIKFTWEAVSELMGHAPPPALVDEIKGIALEHPEVLDAHDVIVHQYGRKKVISLHIGLSKDTSLDRSHTIAEEVEANVSARIGGHTTVHVDPVAEGDELDRIRAVLDQFSRTREWVLSFHDVRLSRNADGSEDLILDLVVTADSHGTEGQAGIEELVRQLRAAFPSLRQIRVQMEPPFAR